MTRKTKNFAAIIPNTQSLQSKAGIGTIPSSTIKKCQALLDNNAYDFTPIGQGILDRLHSLIEKTRKQTLPYDQATEKMLECIMQLKANGSMFQYPIVSTLSEMTMEFIETLPEIDENTLPVIDHLHSTLSTIFEKKIKGNEKRISKELEKKLASLCAENRKALL